MGEASDRTVHADRLGSTEVMVGQRTEEQAACRLLETARKVAAYEVRAVEQEFSIYINC